MKLPFLILLLFFTTGSAFAQHYPRYSVIIHELFPDPSPSVGLPSSEFIELRNRSLQIINLKQWKISDGSSTATISSDTYLAPDSLIILCALSAQAQWADYGRTVGLSNFPSLNNEGDQLQLIGPDNSIVHAVAYTEKWYLNPVKALGGWTIEMIDPRQPCMGSENWRASNDSRGGTPGKLNSVEAVLSDLIPPQPLRSTSLDTQQIHITFNESLDSLTASFSGHFNMDPHLPIADVQLEPPFFQTVKIRFKTAMQPNTVYTCSIKEVKDCAGNEMNKPVTLPVGLPSLPQKGDLILNELLFDPEPGKYDFVELYNRSKHILDLRELYLGRKSVAGAILDPIPISRAPFYLFPGSYIVITADAANLMEHHPSADPLCMVEGALLPTMPDDKGSLALATGNGTLIDAVEYASSWHFPLLTKKEGVSLERIDPMSETQDPNNWTSAASLSGFGTPTRQNSQFKNIQRKDALLHVDPSAFSPDNDGYEDLLGLHYSLSKPGYLMQVKIYDAQGTMVAHPLPQATMPQKGTIWWNGTGTGHQLLPPGNYILWAELIHVGGKVSHFKQRVTLYRH